MDLDAGPLSAPYPKINSKWTKDINVRPKNIKILEKSLSSNVSDIGHSKIFLAVSPEEREIKQK